MAEQAQRQPDGAREGQRPSQELEGRDVDLVVVGRIGAAHGVRGWLRVSSFTVPPDNILGYQPWSLHVGGAWRCVQVEAAERRGESFLCRFAGVADRDAAAALRGALVAVPGAALPALDEGEYYWRDLIGLDVATVAGTALGRVENLMETGANDALVARDGQRERLIPFVGHVVRAVDLQGGVIVVDWDADF